MAIHKLQIDAIDEVDFELIAIHSTLEDYRLAYFINQKLAVLLSKNKKEIVISIKEGEAHFSRFSFEDPDNEVFWDLIQNKNGVIIQKKYSDKNLFENTSHEVTTNVYLLPEFKKVDFILKVQNSGFSNEFIANAIKTIDRVITVYPLDAETIKSKNNLIF
jgi:hypothetical protein